MHVLSMVFRGCFGREREDLAKRKKRRKKGIPSAPIPGNNTAGFYSPTGMGFVGCSLELQHCQTFSLAMDPWHRNCCDVHPAFSPRCSQGSQFSMGMGSPSQKLPYFSPFFLWFCFGFVLVGLFINGTSTLQLHARETQ